MMRALTRGLGELMLTAGALLLLFVAWQLWWTDVEANREQAQIADDLVQEWEAAPVEPAPAPDVPEAEPVQVAEVPFGDAFALIRVPEFGDDYVRPIVEGTSLDVLERGVGHYADAAGPGEVGNFALAGHRVTYGKPFNLIAELDEGDPIVVETRTHWYVYEMRSSEIVTPDRVDVVAPVPGDPGAEPTEAILTMTACHPMFSARERFIVHAVLAETRVKADGPPTVLAQG